jgi:hypothetical protein
MRKISLHTYGDLHFEKTEAPELIYTAIIENYHIEDARAYIKITSDKLCEQTIETIDTILMQLEKMHNIAKRAYLDDFNDEEENVYIGNIYKKILSETEFTLLMQQAFIEQRLLFAINLTSVEINLRNENISTVFTYIKGYELVHKYKFSQDCEHTELIFQAGPCIMKEQLSTFIDMRELPLVNEICSRFRKDWQNYPVKSYFVYLMARRIKHYLKTVMQ